MRSLPRWLLVALLGFAMPMAVATHASAQCGGEGQNACGLSCARNLVFKAGKCVHPPCGRDGDRACVITERIPSCDDGLVELAGRCVVRNACGAEGQRACLVVERTPSCNAGLVESGGRCGHPPCGRLNERACVVTERIPSCDGALVEVSGKCVARQACGGEGQRACLVSERTPSCNKNLVETSAHTCNHPDCGRLGQRACPGPERPGIGVSCDDNLVEVPGCSGDCRGSSGRCVDRTAQLSEPTTNMVRELQRTDPMAGFADIHVHMFANLAFGQGVVVGAPYDPAGGIAKALPADFGTNLDLVSMANTPMPVRVCPPLIPNCGRTVMHGDHTIVDDTMGLGTGDSTHGNFGAPFFTAWPTWRSTTHQQVYYRWLERAWRGGMRLMTMLAVHNEFACGSSKHLRGAVCNQSMPHIDAQLDAAIAFEAWHSRQPGGGWFHIVKDPDDAEATIRAGKLAVVLGIEVDTLFNCKLKANCTPEAVAAEVDKYYAKGVRHIFPVHDFDTQFAGSALFMDPLGAANKFITGEIFVSQPCPGISDKGTLNCNVRGLTPAGEALINKLMDKGMLIDLDHISAKGFDGAIALARKRGGYPFMIGHGLFNEKYVAGKNRHERMRTKEQLEALRGLGSLVSVMTSDEMNDKETSCLHSSVSFADNYTYAVSKMGVVAFGSDFNGMAQHPGPRYGDDACDGNAGQARGQLKRARLTYPFTIPGFGVFDKQVTGQRTFDFNFDGMAHVGLYPDLLADLLAQGVDINPLMKSAAGYVSTWRLATQKRVSLPMKPSLDKPLTPKLTPGLRKIP